jgi:uracil-DNA glycosylase
VTDAARRAALEAIAAEVRDCTRCRLHEGRTKAVPGEGHPETEVVFVGEGPGFNEDRQGRPFVGRAGDFLVRELASIGWRRDDVFITNVVKCRPPDNRDPEPDEIAACGDFLRRQLEILDPALVVTLGRHSMARFMPGTSITRAHGTLRPVDPATGAANAMVFAMYHPAAALRSTDLATASMADAARIPAVLEEARARREGTFVPSEPAAGAPSATGVAHAIAGAAHPRPVAVTGPGADPGPRGPEPLAAPVEAGSAGPEPAQPELLTLALETAESSPAPSGTETANQLTLFG